MSEIAETTEDELFNVDIADEALEYVGREDQASFTLGSCTGLSVCPG
jgi:hypothetical protein